VGTVDAIFVGEGIVVDIHNPLIFKLSSGTVYQIDWRDYEILQDRDPDGYTVSIDHDEFLLTAEDCVLLWSQKISC
jgi:hypothetical protein